MRLGAMVSRMEAVRNFMTDVVHVPLPPMVVASAHLQEILGTNALFSFDACLGPGFSTKTRGMSSILYHMCERRNEKAGGGSLSVADTLRTLLEGTHFVVASTGSHARSMCAFSQWMLEQFDINTSVEVILTADAPSSKQEIVAEMGASLSISGDFAQATANAIDKERVYATQNKQALFIPTDPIDKEAPSGLFNWSDGTPGMATILADLTTNLDLLDESGSVERLVIPTSGGATWSACHAVSEYLRANSARFDLVVPNSVTAVGSVTSQPVRSSLVEDTLVSDYVRANLCSAINGLDQPDMSPWAFDATRNVPAAKENVFHVGCSMARLAQLIIRGETGVLPEPAGAAGLGCDLELQFSRHASLTSQRFARLMAIYGVTPTEIEKQVKLDAKPSLSREDLKRLKVAVGAAPATRETNAVAPASTKSVYVVTGAWEKQNPTRGIELVEDELRSKSCDAVRVANLSHCLAYGLNKDGISVESNKSASRVVHLKSALNAIGRRSVAPSFQIGLDTTRQQLQQAGIL